MVSLGRLLNIGKRMGGRTAEAGALGVGTAQYQTRKNINQVIDVITNRVDVTEIIKYAVYLAIMLGIFVFVINFGRGLLVATQQAACSTGNAINFFDWGGEVDCSAEYMSYFYWAWDIEWIALCLLYISLGVGVGLLIYKYTIWLFNHLLRADAYIKQIEDWIFGFGWEGTADERIETRL